MLSILLMSHPNLKSTNWSEKEKKKSNFKHSFHSLPILSPHMLGSKSLAVHRSLPIFSHSCMQILGFGGLQ